MDRSSVSEPSQKENTQHSSTRNRVKKIPSTPRPEVAEPPMPYATALPAINTSQPPETSIGESYMKIIKDMMGYFIPTGKMSDLLLHMVDEIKKEEAKPNPIPIGIPIDAATLTEKSAAQTPIEQTTSQNPSPAMDPASKDDEAKYDKGVEKGEEGNSQGKGEDGKASDGAEEVEEEGQGNEEGESKEESVERKSTEKEHEVVVLVKEGSSIDGKAVDERAVRRNLRAARRNGEEEPEDTPEEAAAERQAAERKRKGKQIATFRKKRKLRRASRSVVIQELIMDLTRMPY